jgi:hypothetical protein
MTPLPNTLDSWRNEIAAAYVETRASLMAGDDTDDEDLWHHIEDRAVALARAARGLPELDGAQEDIDRMVDAITDLTEALRRYAGGDPNDHHIGEEQFFLLYYLAAQVHGGKLSEASAGAVVRDCWDDAADDSDEQDIDEDDEEDAEDEPWPIQRPPPFSPAAWLDEMRSAWTEAGRPPPLRSAEGRPVVAAGNDLRESAIILALQRRGCTPPAEGVYGLIGVITEMEEDIAGLGPELAALKRNPVMAFVLYYLWTHILIGHADEETAMAVVQAATSHLDTFEGGGLAQRKGSSRFRRGN